MHGETDPGERIAGLRLERIRFQAMGCPCCLRVYTATRREAAAVADAAVAEVRRLEAKYSRYRDDSLTSRIRRSAGAAEGIDVDAETAGLLDYAETCFVHSGGLFDLTAGVLRRAWDFRSGRLPSSGAVAALLERVGWQRVEWRAPRLRLPVAGMELDFGGCVKEYAADRVAELCRSLGVRHGLVDLGGDLAVVGPHPEGARGGRAWHVGVRDPRRPDRAFAWVALGDGGLATSGDYERFMEVDGRRYGHVLDPRSGWPVDGVRSVTVAAPHCLVAGSAATIALLRGAEDGPRWLDELGLPSLRVEADGRVSGGLGTPIRGAAAAGDGWAACARRSAATAA